MVNTRLFNTNTNRSQVVRTPKVNAVNHAGGDAYKLTSKQALAQYVVTGCLNSTYYTSEQQQLETALALASKVEKKFLAKCAVYGAKYARMKDMPALLFCKLMSSGDEGVALACEIFDSVVYNTKMLRNVFAIMRSGQAGRKNWGTAIRRKVAQWLESKPMEYLFNSSIGNNPTLDYVMKLAHVRPSDKIRENFHSYLFGRKYDINLLPSMVQHYEWFKQGLTEVMPEGVNFMKLTQLPLNEDNWKQLAETMSWDALRQNLNSLARHGVFNDTKLVNKLAKKLGNKDNVELFNQFPYQIMTTLLNVDDGVPSTIVNALKQALDCSLDKIPNYGCKVAVCVDTSGSMHNSITGNRKGSTSKVTCVDVAALIASGILTKNPGTLIVPFDTQVHPCTLTLHSQMSITDNARALAQYGGGGTACGIAMDYINGLRPNELPDLVIYVSDNESWADICRYGSTSVTQGFEALRKNKPNAKLVCIDLTPNTTSQTKDTKHRLNVGGFSDEVFGVIQAFLDDSQNFVYTIENKVKLRHDEDIPF